MSENGFLLMKEGTFNYILTAASCGEYDDTIGGLFNAFNARGEGERGGMLVDWIRIGLSVGGPRTIVLAS